MLYYIIFSSCYLFIIANSLSNFQFRFCCVNFAFILSSGVDIVLQKWKFQKIKKNNLISCAVNSSTYQFSNHGCDVTEPYILPQHMVTYSTQPDPIHPESTPPFFFSKKFVPIPGFEPLTELMYDSSLKHF